MGYGPVRNVSSNGVVFEDVAGTGGTAVSIDMVIMATGYKKDCLVAREDQLNGLFLAGFGNDRLFPLETIGEEAVSSARKIAQNQGLR